MRKVHITLVGGQPAPVYHGIVATKPDYVVFVYSTKSQRSLNALKAEIDLPSEEILLDPLNPQEILGAAVSIANKFKEDEITVNISSGLKSWSHFFGIVFNPLENASVVYMDQNNVLWNYRTMTSQSDYHFDMHVLFRLYGNSLDHYKRFKDYTPEDIDSLQKIEAIRAYNNREFNQLFAVLNNDMQKQLKEQDEGTFTLPKSPAYVEWEKGKDDVPDDLLICLYRRGIPSKVKLESKNAISLAFNSGWFEYKVAKMLSGWDKAKEICMNCRFPFKDNIDKNEVDIIVNTGTKLVFVECKTQITQNTDIDKFRSVVKGYGGTGSKGIFITMSPMQPVARKKCEDNGLLSFSIKDSHENGVEADLYRILDSELFNINTK